MIRRYLRCPDCGKRGVHLVLLPRGEDNYQCRYCSWYAFTVSGADVDVKNLDRLREANPEEADTL